MNANVVPKLSFQIVVKYILNRQITQTLVAADSNFIYPSSGLGLSQDLLQKLYVTFTTCNSPTMLPNFYNTLVRLNTIGNSYKPRPINYTDSNGNQPYV